MNDVVKDKITVHVKNAVTIRLCLHKSGLLPRFFAGCCEAPVSSMRKTLAAKQRRTPLADGFANSMRQCTVILEVQRTRLIYEQNESCEATIGSFQTTHHIKFLNAWGFVRNILINIVWK